MLYYIIFIEFSMIYTSSLYFVSHHLFQGRLKKKKIDSMFTNRRIFWEK